MLYRLRLKESFLKHIEKTVDIPVKFLQEMDTTHASLVVRNKNKIRLTEVDNIDGMGYVLTNRKIIQDYNKSSNKNLMSKVWDFIKGEVVVTHEDMDWFCHEIFGNKKLLSKYFPSLYGFA